MIGWAELLKNPDGSDRQYLIRWRGREEGPYPAAVIEAKLAANEIGMLHEIRHNGQWVTLRDYMNEREAFLRAEAQARAEQEQKEREATERAEREREEQDRVRLLEEERRKNDLMAGTANRMTAAEGVIRSQSPLKKDRGGLVLTLGLVGLFVCGPMSLAAWVMGNADLHEMDLEMMDARYRLTTSAGRTIGAVGTILWILGFLAYLVFNI